MYRPTRFPLGLGRMIPYSRSWAESASVEPKNSRPIVPGVVGLWLRTAELNY